MTEHMAVSTQPSTPRSGRERRAYPRIQRRLRVLVVLEDCALDEPYGAWIVDTSRGGVRLAMGRETIAEGAVLHIRKLAGHKSIAWFTVRVKHRRRKDGVWELGCAVVPVSRPSTLPSQRAG
ncbi:MAG: PilZ domain-containing protein [Gemmataceae bacterium]|nr:PilZ domain-containing protein [Gemmataceae bacterium]